MQSSTIYTTDLQNFNNDTITLSSLPMEVGYVLDDSTQRIQSQESVPIAELGKQLLCHAKKGETESVRDLMCRGAPFQADQMGTSALHFAAQNNHLETADVLLRAGISRDARTKVERTPLHMAAYEGHDQMALLLLRYGADVDSRDMLKMTPLHWAIECEQEEVMHVLLDHGADPKALSKFDKTPITLAFEHHRIDLVDIMQQEREIIKPKPIQYDQPSEFETQNLIKSQIEKQKLEAQQQFDRNVFHVPVMNNSQIVYQQIFPTSVSDDDQDKNAELIDRISNISYRTFDKQKDISEIKTIESPYELLKAIMIPTENDSSIVENAVASGGKLVMTEAGKRAYNLTGANQLGVKRLQLGNIGKKKDTGKKIITIARADQFLNHPSNIIRGPNILKKANTGIKTGNLILAPLHNNTTNLKSVKIGTEKTVKVIPMKDSTKRVLQQVVDDKGDETSDIISNNDNMEQITDVAILNKQLAEARRMAADYREKLRKKEAEAEIYEQQLKKIKLQNKNA